MKNDITLTAGQTAAIQRVKAFMDDPQPGHLTLAGAAGTGKTTLIAAMRDLFPNAIISAPTNKAVGVLRQKGFAKATTLDKATKQSIYKGETRPPNEEEIRFYTAEGLPIPDVIDVESYEKFSLNTDGQVLIVDEASMVSRLDMENATGQFDKVIFVGDAFQLPPVMPGTCGDDGVWFQACDPDIQLDEIVRTAAESEITQLAGMLRSQNPAWKKHPWKTGDVVVARRSSALGVDELWERADVVLAHKNDTCDTYNSHIRAVKKLVDNKRYDPLMPVKGDKLLAWQTRTVSGINIVKSDSYDVLSAGPLMGGYAVKMRCPTTDQFGLVGVNKAVLQCQTSKIQVSRLLPFSYAHCITGHKSQGSEWDSVIVLAFDKARSHPDYWNWLYTACTRAKKHLTILI